MASNLEEMNLLVDACREAGKVVRKMQAEGFEIYNKSANDYVTDIDFAVDKHLQENLITARPDYGWISEEQKITPEELAKKSLFVVDPIDGTGDLIRESDIFSISIALIKEGEIIAGAVYNPTRDEMFSAAKGQGAFFNGKKVSHEPLTKPIKDMDCAVSISEHLEGRWEDYAGELQTRPFASIAYKLGLVGGGLADTTVSLRPKNSWDIAAGHIICEEAGCKVTDLSGNTIHYDDLEKLVNGMVVAPKERHDELFKLVESKNSAPKLIVDVKTVKPEGLFKEAPLKKIG